MKVSTLLAAAAVVALTIPAFAQTPAPGASAPTTTPAPSAKPAVPAPGAAAKPGATTGAATRAEQFKSEADAKKGCKTDAVVWVVSSSNVFYPAESKDYGKAKDGAYMCKADAERAGNKAAKDEKKG